MCLFSGNVRQHSPRYRAIDRASSTLSGSVRASLSGGVSLGHRRPCQSCELPQISGRSSALSVHGIRFVLIHAMEA